MATFGFWTTIGREEGTRNKRILCKCVCGTIRSVRKSSLESGDSTSCGCVGKQAVEERLVGKQFGGITVLANVGRYKNKQSIWLCKCSCGKEFTTRYPGRQKGCGCTRYETTTKHGLHKHPLYHIWTGMRDRCKNPRNQRAHRYSLRGITVCHEWDISFPEFYKFAMANGWQHGLQIDRKDNDKGYFPDNVRFVESAVNARNRGTNKLSEDDVDYIRTSTISGRALARELGITPVHANAIRRHDRWKSPGARS